MTLHDKEEMRFKLWIDTYLCILPIRGEIIALDRANSAVKEFDTKFPDFPIKVEESHQSQPISPGKDGYNWNKQERRLYVPIANKEMVKKLLSLLPIEACDKSITEQSIWDVNRRLFTIVYVQER